MKIAFITGDNVVRSLTIETALSLRDAEQDQYLFIEETFLLPGRTKGGAVAHLYRKCGARYVIYKMVEILGLDLAARLTGRWPTLTGLAKQYRAQRVRSTDVNDNATLEALRSFGPDVVVSMSMQRIGEALIAIPLRGVLNVHLGLLPEYQGLGCYIHPLLDGADETGATIHEIRDEKFDTGPIVARGVYPIRKGDSVCRLQLKNATAGGQLLALVLNALDVKEVTGRPQGDGRYYSLPNSEQIKQLGKIGHRLITVSDIAGWLSGPPGEIPDLRVDFMDIGRQGR